MPYRYAISLVLLVIGLAACSPRESGPQAGGVTETVETAAPLTAEGLVGDWSGVLKIPGGNELTLILHLQDSEDELVASLDSPDQAAYGIEGDEVQIEDGALVASFPSLNASLKLTSNGTDALKGMWSQGLSLPITMTRGVTLVQRNRPQEPSERAYVVETVSFPGGSDEVVLAGELTLPDGPGPFPAVILISGSGPQDRNEALMGHKPFLVLSDHLTRQGYAVLRYDDRGHAESSGDHHNATTADFAADAAAGLRFMSGDPRIASDRIAYIGHSEGGLIAPLAAQTERPKAMVLLAAPSTTLGEVIVYQTGELMAAEGSPAPLVKVFQANTVAVLDLVRGSEDLAATREDVIAYLTQAGIPEGIATTQARASVTAWMVWILDYDPVPAVESFEGPILALYGSKDLQVAPSQNVEGMRAAMTHPDSKLIVLDDLNHMFQPAQTGAMSEYINIETTFSPDALNEIHQWLDDNL